MGNNQMDAGANPAAITNLIVKQKRNQMDKLEQLKTKAEDIWREMGPLEIAYKAKRDEWCDANATYEKAKLRADMLEEIQRDQLA